MSSAFPADFGPRWPHYLHKLRQRSFLAAHVLLVLIAAAVLAPLASLVHIAFIGDAEIWPHLISYVLPTALVDTAMLLAGVAILTGAVGIGAAWLVTAYRFPLRDTLTWLLALPLAFPTYIVAYVYVDVLGPFGPAQTLLRAAGGYRNASEYWFPDVRSLPGAIFVMGVVLYPYVYLAARAMFQTQSAAMFEVARTLGASRFVLMRHVALPLARPALAVGLSLVLLETLNDIGASEYLGVRTLTLSIFTTWLNRGSLPGAAQIACVMLIAVFALMALERYGRRHRRFAVSARRHRPVAPIALRGKAACAAILACLAPVLLGFFIPGAYLLHEVIARGLLIGFDPELVRHTITTVSLAAIATVIAVAIGLAAALAARLVRQRTADICLMLASLGYAVPGTVLALGLLSPLVGMDNGINWLTRTFAGVSVGLVIAGSSAALVIAYVLRFLAIAAGSAQAGLSRISHQIDDVARTLGQKPGAIAWRIHLPLSRPALAGAALLVFVDCLKELPATLLLRPLNVETLSTYIYQFATRGNFEEGALAALIIVAVGILPVIRVTRFADIAPAPVVDSPGR
jgi:iron(III) transport system permease protein